MSLQIRLSDLITAIGTDIKQLRVWVTGSASGDLTGLTTTAKTSLLAAINEVNGKVGTAGAQINDTTASSTTVYSSSKTDSQISAASTNDRARANHTGTQTSSTISDFSSAADARITAQKGAANGLASLGSDGKVPSGQLPSYVDDVLEFTNQAAFPATGETGKIYVALDTNRQYRWTGTVYTQLVASPGTTDNVVEGTTNLYFTTARAAAAAPVQSVAGKTGAVTLVKADVGLGNVDNTSDVNKPVSTAQAAADALALQKSANLSDLASVSAAQTNLGVYSQTALGDPETNLVSLYTSAKA